jgi:DNA replication and repair protein RecF
MFLKKLKLLNFRNYETCEINFSGNKIILVGKNAQGKTNLLESVYYLATLSSFRANNDSELVKKGTDAAYLGAELIKNETDIELSVVINPPKPKTIKVNGLKKSSYSQFMGNLVVVNFGVSDLLLLRGNPSDRRKWLDDAISQIYPAYKDRLNKYNKIRTQRNNLLKEFKGTFHLNQVQKDTLSVFNEQISVSGSNIIHLRQKYLKEIQAIANLKHKSISSEEKEDLVIEYNSTVSGDFNARNSEILTPESILELYGKAFEEKQNEELARTQTVIGPHRDDVSFYINDVYAQSYASQGQQRTIVLALKLSELDFIENILGESPVLLLDDVLAELDRTRQNYLLSSIKKDTQTIITTTDISGFNEEFLKDVEVYNIESGMVVK